MRTSLVLIVLALLLYTPGCLTTNGGAKLTWNQQQALARAAGDNAAIPVLDYTEVTQPAMTELVNAIIKFIETGDISKDQLRTYVQAAAAKAGLKDAATYVDAIVMLIPSNIQANQNIPADVKQLLLSALRDGSLRGIALYDPTHKPVPAPAAKPAPAPAPVAEPAKPAPVAEPAKAL